MVKDINEIDDKWLQANEDISNACYKKQIVSGLNKREFDQKFTKIEAFNIGDMYLDKTSGYYCIRCKKNQTCRRHGRVGPEKKEQVAQEKVQEAKKDDFSDDDDFERV